MGAAGSWSISDIESVVPDVVCMDRRFGEICRFNWLLTEQTKYEHLDLDIYNGIAFPQHEPLTLYADGGALFEGSFNGNTFTVTRRQHPDYDQFREDNPNQKCRSIAELELLGPTGYSSDIAPVYNIDQKPSGLRNQVNALLGPNSTGASPNGLRLKQTTMILGLNTVATWDASVRADEADGFDFASCSILKDITEPGYYQCGRGIVVYVSLGMIAQYALSKNNQKRSTWIPSADGGYWINTAAKLNELAITDCDTALSGATRPFNGPLETWKAFDEMEKVEFAWIPPGTDVFIEEESEELYTVSLLPGTVDSVAAYRTGANGRQYLTEVPADMYTVYTTNYTGYSVVEIGMNKQLTRYQGKRWTDDLYVSFTSSVGPNPCDIIQWLIEKYTDKTVDPVTFAAVHNYVANYPCNFYLTERLDVFELINQIAYQSRCSVYIRNDVVYITYLSREPTSLRTITESDILTESFRETLSETEDVYTVHKINWQQSGAWVDDTRDPSKQIILKYNIPKYGTVEEEWDYNCYNDFSLVLKSATFWLIRKANSWRKVNLKLPIKHIDLDIGDCVTLSVANFGAAIKTIVESISYAPNDNTLAVTLWTPIRSGETSQYFWAWPSQKPTRDVWPLPLDSQAGGGYTFTVTPPLGHILRGGVNRFDQVQMSSGDYHPSDLDDVFPTVSCLISDYTEFYEEDWEKPEIENKRLAQSAWQAPLQAGPSSGLTPYGGGGGGGSKKKKSPPKPEAPVKKKTPEPKKPGSGQEDEPADKPCVTTLFVTIHTSEAQGTCLHTGGCCGGPCECSGGCPSCYGATWIVEYVVPTNDLVEANEMKAMLLTMGGLTGGADGMSSGGGSKNAHYGMGMEDGHVTETGAPEGSAGKSISGSWACGETGVLYVHIVQTGVCVPPDPDSPGDSWDPLPDLEPGAYEEAAAMV